jgi:hypothetical protein
MVDKSVADLSADLFMDAKLLGIEGLVKEMFAVMKPDYVPFWFYTAHDAFNGRTPYELCRDGDTEPLKRMLYYLSSGTPS